MNFTITPAAEKFIRLHDALRMATPGSGFRLVVSPGGCSGLAADISVAGQPAPGDAIVERDGVKLFLPAESRSAARWRHHRFRRYGLANRARVPRSEATSVSAAQGALDGRAAHDWRSASESKPQAPSVEEALLADALLGGGLPPEAE